MSNVIWLNDSNADEFPNAVPLGDVPAGIGDTYDGADFTATGGKVRTLLEQAASASAGYARGARAAGRDGGKRGAAVMGRYLRRQR